MIRKAIDCAGTQWGDGGRLFDDDMGDDEWDGFADDADDAIL